MTLDNVLDLLPDEIARRREIFRIAEFLSDTRVSGLIAGKLRADGAQALGSFEAMQFAVQAVVQLTGRLTNGVFGRSLRIVKYRGSDHDNIETPFVIDRDGIAVAYHGDGAPKHKLSTDRLSTGIGGLYRVLDGGYQRGYAVLVSGAPGTAKTTLGSSFLAAGAEAGAGGDLRRRRRGADGGRPGRPGPRQAQDELDAAERELATERRRRELEQTIAETQSRRAVLDAALEFARRELELSEQAERKRQELDAEKAGRIRRRREGGGE